MFALRAYRCPSCSADNGADAVAITTNEEAGVETWGPCWSCDREFEMSAERRIDGAVARMVAGYRSPVASNIAFAMWHPLQRRKG